MMNKHEIKKMMKMKKEKSMEKEHHSGKGTKARVNTMAEKMFFNSHVSK